MIPIHHLGSEEFLLTGPPDFVVRVSWLHLPLELTMTQQPQKPTSLSKPF